MLIINFGNKEHGRYAHRRKNKLPVKVIHGVALGIHRRVHIIHSGGKGGRQHHDKPNGGQDHHQRQERQVNRPMGQLLFDGHVPLCFSGHGTPLLCRRKKPCLNCVSVHHSHKCQQAECYRNACEGKHNTHLAPAAQLQMVVQGRHTENPLAVGELEIAHLNDIAHGFGDIDDPHQHQDQRNIQGKRHSAHRAPQEQGSGVPHEHLGGVEVIHQEAQQTSCQRPGENAHRPQLPGKLVCGAQLPPL